MALLAVTLPMALGAQQPGVLRGTVFSAAGGTRVAAAVVEIGSLGIGARTDSSGSFILQAIPSGTHLVRVRAIGFAPLSEQVTVAGDSVTRVWSLTPRPAQELSAVEIRAPLYRTEFEERRLLGRGHFILPAEWERSRGKRVSDVLSRVPGMRIERRRGGAEAFAMNSRGTITMHGSNPKCYVHVYVDDVMVTNSAATDFPSRGQVDPVGAFNLNGLATVDIYGAEYYAGGASVPAKYNRTGAACGVLLLWTRR